MLACAAGRAIIRPMSTVTAYSHRSLGQRLAALMDVMRKLPGCSGLARVAIALFDPRTETLRAYAHAGDSNQLLDHYEVGLRDVPSLALLASGEEPRIVDDLEEYGHATSPHTIALREAGYRSSLTIPVWRNHEFVGFVFLNTDQVSSFTPLVVDLLRPFASGMAEMAIRELASTPR